jgi:hypothetical protein
MCIKKRGLIGWGMAVAAVALLVGVWGLRDEARPVGAQVDWCEELQQEIDALNRGEIDLENYADDMVFQASPICDEVECVGKDAYRNYLEHYVDLNRQLTITSCEVSGNTVATTAEVAYDASRAAGVDRLIGGATYEIQGDKIVAVRNLPTDMTDPQTAQFVAYWLARPKPAFEMGPGRDADQSPGTAEMHGYPDFVMVFVRIAPGPSGVPQPINIHEGTCANLGPVAFSLGDVDGGVSHTILRGVSVGDLQTGNFAIAVQQSQDDPDVFVACGDIPAAAAEEAPPEAPPAEETPVIAPAPPTTGTGGLLAEEDNGIVTWWYALAAGGTLLVMAGLAGLGMARRRR